MSEGKKTNANVFGDGSDGAITIESSAELERTVYFTSFAFAPGATLKTNGNRVHISGEDSMTEQRDAEKAAEEWEYTNFEWRKHQELPFKKLEKLRRTIELAFLAGVAWAAPKWISVAEKMPEEGIEVLVITDNGNCVVAQWNKTQNVFTPSIRSFVGGYDYEIDDVLISPRNSFFNESACFWMPLPAAPKEEK